MPPRGAIVPIGRDAEDAEAIISRLAPEVSWRTFRDEIFAWEQGEHVAFIGPTGQGKTTTALQIIDERSFVTVLATKPRDDTMDYLFKHGYVRFKEWKNSDPEQIPHRVLWPPAHRLYSAQSQRSVFRHALDNIYPQGGWCLYFDELWYFVNHLKLSHEVKTYLLQARSLDISVVCSTQRPSSVPLEVYDMSTHLFFWRDNDRRNLDRLSELNAVNGQTVKAIISRLPRHQFLYVNTRVGEEIAMCRTTAPRLDEI